MWNKHEGFASTYFILRKIHLNPCARKNWHHLTPFLPTFGHHFPCPKHRRSPRRPRTMCMCCNFSWTRCSSVVLRVSHHPCQFLRQNYSNILPKRFFETFWNFKKHFDLKSSFQQKKTGKKHPWCCFIHRFPNVSPANPPPPRRGQMAQFHSSAGEAALASAARCRSWEADEWVKTSYDIWKVRPLRCIHDSDLMISVYIIYLYNTYIYIYISIYVVDIWHSLYMCNNVYIYTHVKTVVAIYELL